MVKTSQLQKFHRKPGVKKVTETDQFARDTTSSQDKIKTNGSRIAPSDAGIHISSFHYFSRGPHYFENDACAHPKHIVLPSLRASSHHTRCEEDVEVRREAARLLFALSLNELNKLDVAGIGTGSRAAAASTTAEVATELVGLARSDDPCCARNAVGALANLSENDATHERLLSWGASFLSALAVKTGGEHAENDVGEAGDEGLLGGGVSSAVDVGLVREVTRCLTNLSGNYAMHAKLLEGGVADALVVSLKREDAITTRFAALGLANLSGQVRKELLLPRQAGSVLWLS